MKPKFRNPDKFQVLPFRKWLRNNLPEGTDGVVLEDVDLVSRIYGIRQGTDDWGKIMYIELKFGNTGLDTAKNWTFKLMDALARAGDPAAKKYRGYFLINYSNENWDIAKFKINGINVSKEELKSFFLFKPYPKILPLFQGGYRESYQKSF